jgi:hypothetical protein
VRGSYKTENGERLASDVNKRFVGAKDIEMKDQCFRVEQKLEYQNRLTRIARNC